MTLLEIGGLRAGYGRVEVLHDISLAVDEGEFTAIVGANGAGKTTLLRAVSGLTRLFGGDIRLAGDGITGLPPYRVPTLGVAHVPEGRRIFPELSVRENLLVGARANRERVSRERQMSLVLELFPRLSERLRQRGGTLSGGEQQMLAIGRALMSAPRLLMLDEPSQGLAPLLVTELYRTLAEIASNRTTILLVEQNVSAALAVAQSLHVLEQGRIVMQGGAADLRDNDEIRRRYLGI